MSIKGDLSALLISRKLAPDFASADAIVAAVIEGMDCLDFASRFAASKDASREKEMLLYWYVMQFLKENAR